MDFEDDLPPQPANRTQNQRKTQKRMIVSVHSSIKEEFIAAVSESIKTLRFADIDISEYVPESTVSITYNGTAIKPMIYIDPPDLDEGFLLNIERKSLVLSDQITNIKLNTLATYNDIIMLPLHVDSFKSALNFVLAENKIIGIGFPTRFYGDIWKEILNELPNISNKHSETIASQAKNRDQFIATYDSLLKKGIPQRVLKTVMTFLTASDPNTFLVQPNAGRKKKIDDD